MASGDDVRAGQDGKLRKLADKIEGNPKLSGGARILIAVPVKRGGIIAAGAGALSGSTSRMVHMRNLSRKDVDRAASAGSVHQQMGDGSDFVLCLTADAVRILRLVGFGVMTGTPTVVPNDAVLGLDTSPELKKKVHLVFPDGSVLPFTVPMHRDALAQVAAQVWPEPADA